MNTRSDTLSRTLLPLSYCLLCEIGSALLVEINVLREQLLLLRVLFFSFSFECAYQFGRPARVLFDGAVLVTIWRFGDFLLAFLFSFCFRALR